MGHEIVGSGVLLRGFLDRKPGLILSGLYAYYTFVKYAKLWEIMRKPLGPQDCKIETRT